MLTTERLILRPFFAADGNDLYEYLSDPAVVEFEPYRPLSLDECHQEAERRANDGAFIAVCLKENGKLIGNIYFDKREYDAWELGFVFNAAYQGKGYAYESAKEVLRNAFSKLGIRRVVACCNPLNEKSWRLLERLGLRREGHLRQNVYFWKDENGRPMWKDTYEYGMLAEEWKG